MTSEELKKNWKKYVMRYDDNGDLMLLKEFFVSCEEYKGGLLFRFRDASQMEGCIGDIFRPDENDNCHYLGTIEEGEEPWERSPVIGKFLPRDEQEVVKIFERVKARFMAEHYSKKKYRKYVNGCGLSSVGECDKNASSVEKDLPCIRVNLRKPLPEKLAFPKEFQGMRVFTEMIGQIQPYGKLR